MLKSNLLATKFHRPTLPAKRVQRPRLSQQLTEGLVRNRPITLISAPAGFGKTTCVSQWLDTLENWPVSWLSLDSADDDPGRFFTYFIAALQKIKPELGQEIADVLHSGQLPPSEIISTILINDILAAETRFLLIVDDFHVIQDPFILQVMENLVTNLPQPLHLVLLTREDPLLPLARLRANNQLTEIRARDLRFTGLDANQFLNEAMGLSLSPADIIALENKTEGWIVGLQLAGLSIRDRKNPSGFIAALSGSHRFILSYLTEQVLDQQPGDVRQFLLQTAVLDRLNGDLCDAVTGRTNGRFLLERLFKANLFLIPLDDAGQWYRYHHLFADLLRDRQIALGKEETAVLHQRASQWYAQENMTSPAIHHALTAEDYGTAVALLENHAMQMIMQGYIKTVNGWMDAIPQQWQSQSPRTHLALAWMYLLGGAYAQAAPYLERLRETLDENQAGPVDVSLQADWLVMQSLVLYMQGQPAASEAMAKRALDMALEENGRVRSLAYYAWASACWLRKDYTHAAETYRLAIQYSRAANNLVAEMMSTISLAIMAFEQGHLHFAFEIAEAIDKRGEQSGPLPPISAVVFGVLGEVCLQWNQLDEAQRHTQRSLHLSRLGGYNTGVIFAHVTLSRLAQIQGDLATAAQEIQTAVDLLPVELPEYIRQEVAAQQVNLYLARHRLAAAKMVLQGLGFSFQGQFNYPHFSTLSHSLGLLYNSGLRVMLYQAGNGRDQNNLQAGIELANRLISTALDEQQIPIALETYLLRAQLHAMLGSDETSRADYARALELAEPEGFIGIFLEQGPRLAEALAHLLRQNQLAHTLMNHARRILDAFARLQTPDAPAQLPLIEPLSDRELEVLQLMAAGLKYKEIAAQLFISLNTVRYHVKALYGKLNVNNRTQAIAAARQHKIL